MMKINIKESKNQHADLLIPKEYDRLWGPQHIRYDIKAYYLMTLYFELIQKIAMPFNLGEKDLDQAGNFSVLSNALFYMDESVQKKNFLPEQHLILFLVKFLYHLGIIPDTQFCGYCRTPLHEGKGVYFLPEHGQFSCRECYPGESSTDDRELMKNVLQSYQTKYSEYADLKTYKFRDCDKLLLYFCQQFQLKPLELKSYKLLFS